MEEVQTNNINNEFEGLPEAKDEADAEATVKSDSSNGLELAQDEKSHSTSERALKQENRTEPCWENLPDMMYSRIKFVSATHGNQLYVFGGTICRKEQKQKVGRKSNKVEMFDPQTNTWTELPNMPHAKSNCSCALVGDNIYVIGGEIKDEKRASYDSEAYNIKTKTWSTLPPMNHARASHSSVAIGDLIYVFGGYRGKGSTEVYDTVAREWNVRSRMNIHRYSFTSVVVNNKIYAIGGMKEFPSGMNRDTPQYHRYLETMEEYDIETNKWIFLVNEKMGNRRAGCSAVVVGSTIKVLGGYDEKETVSSIESFDILQRKWSGCFIPPSKGPRKHFTTEVIGDSLVVIGGVDDSNLSLLNSVERYSLPADPTINLSIPAINKLSNIDSNQVSPEFPLDKKRKHLDTGDPTIIRQEVEVTKRKRHGTHNITQKFIN